MSQEEKRLRKQVKRLQCNLKCLQSIDIWQDRDLAHFKPRSKR